MAGELVKTRKIMSFLQGLIPRSSTKWYTFTVNSIWKHRVFAYPKRVRYYISRLCFEIAGQFRLSTELYSIVWSGAPFQKQNLAFSFGISKTTVLSKAIDTVSFGK
jgi:hypothetical protein